ncbi:transglycosylase domain-containing protein [Corynebacterium freiburgense]|uniref:transglycosylase domain-containing protein n=1 Tax=Corynebacterium freiburgense TaxID=556548 RepID=UPI00041BB636|nr:Penicillin-binding protein 1A [Corynebacterium freiburgense]
MNEQKEQRKRTRTKAKKSKAGRIIGGSFLVVTLLAIVGPIVAFMVAYLTATVPKPDELVNKQISYIYAADGSTELARVVPPEGNRQQVKFDEIPKHLRDAVLAAEDREFYSNAGFSISGFGRAVLGQITGDSTAGGGSTITQQYVKNAVVGNDRTMTRKFKELVYSSKMANEWSKDEVLAAYLNTIYFGRNSYGVSAAAQAYYGKPLAEITPSEAAFLAGAIQRPSQLDPWTNRGEAETRWNYVLDGMVETGAISKQERDQQVFPEVVDPAQNSAYTEAAGSNGLIKNQVIAELAALGISENDVQTRGLRVVTTIDPTAQEGAVDAVHNILQNQPDKLRSAVVAIDPNTGAVKAYYGGEEATGWDFANAALQTGSTFKVFGLAAGLQQGIPLSKLYSSAPVQTGNVTVTNVEGVGCGTCAIQEALKRSHNTSFIRFQQDLENGPQDVADMAHALGMAKSLPGIPKTLSEDGESPYEGIILGQYQSRPVDVAIALSTLANEGVWHKEHFVQKVETAGGEVLYEHKDDEGERRVSAAVANNVMAAMLPIAAYSNGNTLAGGRQSAAKTGTTQLGDTGQNKDAWMIGATPQLATAVWVGTEDNSPLTNAWGGSIYGSGLPAQIWKATMDTALSGEPFETFGAPSGDLGYSPNPQVVVPTQTAPATSADVVPTTVVPEGELLVPEQELPPLPEMPPAAPEPVEIAPGIRVPNIFGGQR